MSIAFDVVRDGLLICAGAVGAMTLEHGWGFVLAKFKTWRARTTSQAQDLYSEVSSQVKDATQAVEARLAAIEADVPALKADIAAIKTKVGA